MQLILQSISPSTQIIMSKITLKEFLFLSNILVKNHPHQGESVQKQTKYQKTKKLTTRKETNKKEPIHWSNAKNI